MVVRHAGRRRRPHTIRTTHFSSRGGSAPVADRRRTFIAEPGDLIYVPPGLKHDGVALEPCFTYSVGFRVPRGTELGAAFLDWLHERGLPDARYRDPGLRPAANAGRIPPGMVQFAKRFLSRIRWGREDVARFLGEYLTQPKPHVVFRRAAPAPGSGSMRKHSFSTAAGASSSTANRSRCLRAIGRGCASSPTGAALRQSALPRSRS